ncbi:MAG TPA: DMT family transporter [Acetobacteraceae bacterium]|nr:DMT family transporter [Acetobacteraceae bacterium]
MAWWIGVTLAAALFQTWRTALQQKLRAALTANAAGFVRYLYGVPVGVVFLLVALFVTGNGLPHPGLRFFAASATAGVLQIFGTVLLIMAFGHRNFVVGTAYAKTEALQLALIVWIVLGLSLHPLAWVGLGIGVAGVLSLSFAGRGMRLREVLAASVQPAALCGLGAGLAFALTAIFIKAATQALPSGNLVLKALFTLVVTNVIQTLIQGSWLGWHDPSQFRAAFTTWRRSAWVGLTSACGSACWFTAFTLAPVVLVRAVGQVEVVFTLVFSRFYLKERLQRTDVAGLILVIAGVLLVIAGG